MFDRLKMEEPLRIAETILGKLNFDAVVVVLDKPQPKKGFK